MERLIMEKFSKNKRGRPKSFNRKWLEQVPGYVVVKGCLRTQMNYIYSANFLEAIFDAGMVKEIFGVSRDEFMNLEKMPHGYRTMAVELGRYLSQVDDDPGRVVHLVVDALKDGFTFGDVARHFKQARLGKRPGSVESLTQAILNAVDKYRTNFSLMSDEDVLQSLRTAGTFFESYTHGRVQQPPGHICPQGGACPHGDLGKGALPEFRFMSGQHRLFSDPGIRTSRKLLGGVQ